MPNSEGDQAFRKSEARGRWQEMTYGGAVSFLRRKYSRDLAGVDIAVMGVPYDNAVTYRPGCRLGPRAIREASVQMAELDAFPFGFDPFDKLSVVDYGDVLLDPHHPETVHPAIEAEARHILLSGAKLLTLGGDHSIAYPLMKAHADKYGPLALVQFDAHSDTLSDDGVTHDHGTFNFKAVKDGTVDPARSTHVGIRTICGDSMGFEFLTSPWIHRNGIEAALEVVRERAGDAPVYVTFDVDGIDPAFAPGTGTPVSGGLSSWQALEFIRGLGSLNLVGMDVVEVSPPYDHAEITSIAAATVAHDWICLLAQKAGATPTQIGRK